MMNWSNPLIYPLPWDVSQSYVKAYWPHFGNHAPYLFAWLQK